MNENKRIWKHVTANTTQKTIRWPFQQLEDAKECAEFLGEDLSSFVRNATQKMIDETKKKMK